MKGTSLLGKICATAFLFGSAVWAEDASGLIDSSKLNDKKVTDLQGNELGKVERLLVEPKSGQVRYAVIDVGQLLNQQGAEVAVPWQSLKVNREGGANNFTVQLDANSEKLQSAPRFSEAEADRLFTPSGAQPVQEYWTIIVTETPSTANRPPEASSSPNQPSNTGQQGQSGQPNVVIPSDQSGAPSGEGQKTTPRGTQPPGSGNQEGVPPRENATPSPEPSVSVPTESAPTSPDKGDKKDGTPSLPVEPSTTP